MASSPQGEATTASLSAAKEGQDQVEMNTLAANASAAEADTQQEHTPSQPATSPNDAGTTSGAEQPTSSSKPPNRLTRAQSEALGPATEAPIHPPLPTTISTTTGEPRGPTLSITLMLTTGARHPYKLDEKYLRSRKVDIPSGPFDPREISGYKLKELIWTDWRNEWEPRPATPASIRLIVMGRLVDDKAVLKGRSLSLSWE